MQKVPAPEADLAFASTAGGSALELRVRSDGARRVIETRLAGSGRRVAAGCFETNARRLPLELRRMFDSL